MSTTTTTRTTTQSPIPLSMQQTLDDYKLHISGNADPNSPHSTITSATVLNSTTHVSNPSNWPRHHRRIPNYRSLNRDVDTVERPNGVNPAETMFITVMFTGVAMNAASAQLWGMTGGKLFTEVFKYAIGGEW